MYEYKYPHPAVTADTVVFALEGNKTYVLLVKRLNDPFKGCWAFPGGFMNIDEDTSDTAKRELKEETGLSVDAVFQIGAYTAVDRDPRERVITVAYYAEVDCRQPVKGGDDAGKAEWFELDKLPELAFDHSQILADALAKSRINSMM